MANRTTARQLGWIVEAAQTFTSLLNAVNLRIHQVAAETYENEWRTRAAPGTNLLAFTFWHAARAIDADVHMGIRGVPEIIEQPPWCDLVWARAGVGVGYTLEQADELAVLVKPDEVLDYADAVRGAVSTWLKEATDVDLEKPNSFMAHAAVHPAYSHLAFAEQIAWMSGRPVWAILAIAVFAHSWAHLAEMETLRAVLRT